MTQPISVPMKELGFSLVRTFTPYIVGAATSRVAFDAGTLTAFVDGGLAVGYYGLVRWLEMKVSPRFGWLLGVPKTPTYN